MIKKYLNNILEKTSLSGYDFFISYSRRDSIDYAYSLAKILQEKGFDPYLDQRDNSNPGQILPDKIKKNVSSASAFILIGSPGTQQSEPIEQEITTFLAKKRNRPLILIDVLDSVNSNARWFNHIKGLAIINEDPKFFSEQTPSAKIIERIINAINFTKKAQKLRRISFVTAFIFLAIILSSLLILEKLRKDVVFSNNQLVEAEKLTKIEQLKKNFALSEYSAVSLEEFDSPKTIKANVDCDTSAVTFTDFSLFFLNNFIGNFQSSQYIQNEKIESYESFGFYENKIYLGDFDKISVFYLENEYWQFDKTIPIEHEMFITIGDNLVSLVDSGDNSYLNLYKLSTVDIKVDQIKLENFGGYYLYGNSKNKFILFDKIEKTNTWIFRVFEIKSDSIKEVRRFQKDNLPVGFFSSANFINDTLTFKYIDHEGNDLKLNTVTQESIIIQSKLIQSHMHLASSDPEGRFRVESDGTKLFIRPEGSTGEFEIGSAQNIIGVEISDKFIFAFFDCAGNGNDVCISFSTWKVPFFKNYSALSGIAEYSSVDIDDLKDYELLFVNDSLSHFCSNRFLTREECSNLGRVLFFEYSGSHAQFCEDDQECEQMVEQNMHDAEYSLWIDRALSPDKRFLIVIHDNRLDLVDLATRRNATLNLRMPLGFENPDRIVISDTGDYLFFFKNGFIFRLDI